MSAEDAGELPAGVVFDCDGTLADTETLSRRIWTEALAPHGVVPDDDDFTAIVGHAWPHAYRWFSRYADLGPPDRFRAGVRTIAARVHATDLQLFEDAVQVLVALVDRGIPVAVASSSSNAHVRRCLERGRLTDRVTAVIGADDVTHPKPDPEPYHRAAASLRRPVEVCAAVEDTVTGVTSARAAGLRTIAVDRGLVDSTALAAAAHRTVRTLTLAALHVPVAPR